MDWIATNGGYENVVADRLGPGHWTAQEVAPDTRILRSISFVVTGPTAREPHAAAPEPPSASATAKPAEAEVSDLEWARVWARSFVDDYRREHPEADIVAFYRLLVEQIVENTDLLRGETFDTMTDLTDALVRRAAATLRRGHSGGGVIRRPLRPARR